MNSRLKRISVLFTRYQEQKKGKETLLAMLDDAEIAERVYNSNAIENSTLTLPETEKILLEIENSRNISIREIFEAKNLASVYAYVKTVASQKPLSIDGILLLHKMLISNIKDDVAGRFRTNGEMVRVGNHIGLSPEYITQRLEEAMIAYSSDVSLSFIHRIARFHAQFESIHPFIDGNGRIGRVINNYLFIREGFPPIIVRNKDKQHYYDALRTFDATHTYEPMKRIVELAVCESLHKRLAYVEGREIVLLSEYATHNKQSFHTLLNAAKRQTIPAFREKGVWKIGMEKYPSDEK